MEGDLRFHSSSVIKIESLKIRRPDNFMCSLPHKGLGTHIGSLVQDFSISNALAMEILQSCTEP